MSELNVENNYNKLVSFLKTNVLKQNAENIDTTPAFNSERTPKSSNSTKGKMEQLASDLEKKGNTTSELGDDINKELEYYNEHKGKASVKINLDRLKDDPDKVSDARLIVMIANEDPAKFCDLSIPNKEKLYCRLRDKLSADERKQFDVKIGGGMVNGEIAEKMQKMAQHIIDRETKMTSQVEEGGKILTKAKNMKQKPTSLNGGSLIELNDGSGRKIEDFNGKITIMQKDGTKICYMKDGVRIIAKNGEFYDYAPEGYNYKNIQDTVKEIRSNCKLY